MKFNFTKCVPARVRTEFAKPFLQEMAGGSTGLM